MKKVLPIILILLALALLWAWYTTRPAASAQAVIVAAVDLPAGHMLQEEDLVAKEMLPGAIPEGAFASVDALLGKQLHIDRTSGDVLTSAHLGEPSLPLAPNERAVGVQVSDSGGLAGVLRPGDYVGVTAVMLRTGSTSNVYSKVVAEGLRVVYVSPEFRALHLDPEAQATADSSSAVVTQRRSQTGTVNLAVPVDATTVSYVFADAIGHYETVVISLLDLLPALDHASDIELSLFLEPDLSGDVYSSGIYLPDLIVLPEIVPTLTPTPVP